MSSGYETWFGLVERPFSLTPDARYHFRSRAHARAMGGLATGLDRQVPLLLLTGDLGTGKSTLCRTLALIHGPAGPVVYLPNALVSPEELYRRLLTDLTVVAPGDDAVATPDADRSALAQQVSRIVVSGAPRRLLLLVDEAHLLPPSTVSAVLGLAALEHGRAPAVQVVLAAQPPAYGSPTLPRTVEESVQHRARLTALDRDECEAYVQHRLQVAGGPTASFGPRAVEVLYAVSGGIPRLVNLLCERAFQEAATLGLRRLEARLFEAAATALELQRLRARRFRWYGTRPRASGQVS